MFQRITVPKYDKFILCSDEQHFRSTINTYVPKDNISEVHIMF